ncbi:hypothetical protein BSG18_48670 [Pseudomonas ogarae]|nr:hypothetical protein BSG18_48670 [Pseudomonas ogarae]
MGINQRLISDKSLDRERKKGRTCSGSPLLFVRLECQSVTIRECLRVSFMVMYTSSDTAMHAVTYQ